MTKKTQKTKKTSQEKNPKKTKEKDLELDLEKHPEANKKLPPSHQKKTEQVADDLHALIKVLEAKGFNQFMRYLRSPWRIMWTNFLAGIFRGLGILVGMTMVIGLLIWLLTQLIDFPLVGQYFQVILESLKSFTPPEVLQQIENSKNKPEIY